MGFDLQDAARSLLDDLQYEAFAGHVHTTAPGVLSTWESAHHALALRHLDPNRAWRELETLYQACQLQNGLVARERRFALDGQEPASQPGDDPQGRSPFIDPPVAAYAVAQLALDGQLPGEELLERATLQLDAIWGERLPPNTSLPVILHPIESGVPRSALYESVIESSTDAEWQAEVANLARSAIGCRLDPAHALRAGHPFVVEDPVFCGWLLLALEEVGRAWDEAGHTAPALKLRVRSSMIRDAIEERLWWPTEEIYTAFDRARGEPLRGVTIGGLVPAATRVLRDEGAAKRAIDRYLRPSGSPLWVAKGVAAAPLASEREERRLRPGAGVTPLAHYWTHLVLARCGRRADARVARNQLQDLIEAHGFSGQYDPVSGESGDRAGYSLGALLLEMAASD